MGINGNIILRWHISVNYSFIFQIRIINFETKKRLWLYALVLADRKWKELEFSATDQQRQLTETFVGVFRGFCCYPFYAKSVGRTWVGEWAKNSTSVLCSLFYDYLTMILWHLTATLFFENKYISIKLKITN